MEEIVNRVAKSGLVNFNLEDYYTQGKRRVFDLAPLLWNGLVLKEKDFRKALQEMDWSSYKDTCVAVNCSADAVIPVWAYMLVATYLTPIAKKVVKGTLNDLERELFIEQLATTNFSEYKDKRVIIRGCSQYPVPEEAYVYVVQKLQPIAKSIMYGEACSTVPLFKKK